MSYEFYVSIEGKAQSKFKGECTREGHEEQLIGFFFESGIASPRDALTGQANGRRRHQPVLFRKRVGAATPQIAQALCTNELLEKVQFDFVRIAEDGSEKVYFSVILGQATIASARLIVPDSDRAQANQDFYEEVTLTFQSITWNHVEGQTVATDDWNHPGKGDRKGEAA
jgi:type VI secretion system Hcp family effector